MQTNGIKDNLNDIADDARELLDNTADIANEKVAHARNRLSAALDACKDTYTTVQKKTVESAKAADKVIRKNPYQAIGVAFGVGAVVGYLISRRGK